jgi:chromosome segregation ATPase
MTRIVGYLEGANGPLNGRLYVKAGGAFIGAPAKDLSFKVEDGIVDVELPPCPPGMPYFVDWKNTGDVSRLTYLERWQVKAVEEMSIDEARGIIRNSAKQAHAPLRKADLLEVAALRNETSVLMREVIELEGENGILSQQVAKLEGGEAAARGQAASLMAKISLLQNKIAAMEKPRVQIEERIIERVAYPMEVNEAIAQANAEIARLQQENESLKNEISTAIKLNTQRANLQAEITRLNNENNKLSSRVDTLKQPIRSVSAMRMEAIANLDKLTNG